MPPRLRRKQAMKTEKDVISENSEVKIEKKTRVKTRRKRAAANVNKKVDKLVESGHDADSESESKIIDSGNTAMKIDVKDISEDELYFQTCKKLSNDKNVDINNPRKSFTVSVEDCSFNMDIEKRYVKSEKFTKLESSRKKEPARPKRKALNEYFSNPKNKENVTPPDSQSTPALLKLQTRDLNNSLFGFENMATSLPFSPVVGSKIIDNSLISHENSVLTSSNVKYSTKNKKDVTTGFNDIPIKVPKKRVRRKNVKKKEVHDQEEILENIKLQFKEIEKHELLIE